MKFRTASSPTHRAPGPALIDYRGLAAPVGRGFGGAALLGAVAATATLTTGSAEAKAASPTPGATATTGTLPAVGMSATGAAATSPIAPANPYAGQKARPGDRGAIVKYLQERLNANGANLVVDGVFGKATTAAVRSAQSKAGIAVDSVVGPNTWSALNAGSGAGGSASAPAPSSSSHTQTTLRVGSRGDAVRYLQERLVANGASITVDGVFGGATGSAVRSVQSAAGLKVDTVVGAKTWNAIMNGTSASGPAPSGSSTAFPGESIVSMAMQQQGVRYQWGGEHPSTGMDCSGLVYYVYQAHGIKVPRTARQQTFGGRIIPQSEARPGDLVAFSERNWGHIGIYAGNGKIIDASGSRKVVMYRNIWNSPHVFVTYR